MLGDVSGDEESRMGVLLGRWCSLLVLGAASIALLAALGASADESWLPQEPSENPPVTITDASLLVPLGTLVAGALPARALGVGWLSASVISIGALVASLLLVLALGPSFATILAAVAVALGASLLTKGAGATLVVALASVALWIAVHGAYPASTAVGFAMALAGWVVLPTVAGLFVPTGRGDD